MINMKYILGYLIIINIITFCIFATDKSRAMQKQWRIRESVLLGISIIGGALGGLAAMYIFRHKTQTAIFKYGMPIILLIQIVLAYYLNSRGMI